MHSYEVFAKNIPPLGYAGLIAETAPLCRVDPYLGVIGLSVDDLISVKYDLMSVGSE